jgi:hypothetical protein
MQTRTLLGAAATASALAWSAMLISEWCAYTLLSARAALPIYFGDAQRVAAATVFNMLAFKSLLTGLLLTGGILLLANTEPEYQCAGRAAGNTQYLQVIAQSDSTQSDMKSDFYDCTSRVQKNKLEMSDNQFKYTSLSKTEYI